MSIIANHFLLGSGGESKCLRAFSHPRVEQGLIKGPSSPAALPRPRDRELMKGSLIFLRTPWRPAGWPVGCRCAPRWDRVGLFFFPPTSATFRGPVVSTAPRDRKGVNLWEDCLLLEVF